MSKKRLSKGFTLLEVLMAFVILSIALGAVYGSYSGSLRGEGAAVASTQQTLEVRSVFARVGVEIPFDQGIHRGKMTSGDRWELSISRVELLPGSQNAQSKLQAFQLELKVYDSTGLADTYHKIGLGDV